ncbi:HAMP domain-containing sensor histidine kinase [Phenylobacterium sp.]|uniref:sensor histidine kinase n=1 Tax=Phenylobacterium sp. TaxID=1871053 RepID=UPI002DE9D105|nr:HAMP domain-containing sensor histidine kinase [Phenylobacterium sp.]
MSKDAALEAQKRSFLRMVSHELRTPLNSILGFSEILATELYGPLGAPQYQEYAEIVRDSGQKLLKLVNQVLEIARLEGDAMDFEAQPEALGPVIEDLLAGFAAEIAEGAVTVKAPAASLPSVLADERGLKTLLSGLIHNAIVFSPAGGEVKIAALQRGKTVEIAIENPGERFEPADVGRLLQPFEQGETALTRRSHGAGLGLSICALTAKAMGGRLALSARPRGGLAARVTLPAA